MQTSATVPSQIIDAVLALGTIPILKGNGFRKRGRNFYRTYESGTSHLEVQPDRYNRVDHVSFTINLWSYVPAIAKARGEDAITDPTKQKWHGHCGIRIGHLRPDPGDFWWVVKSATEIPEVAQDLASTVKNFAIPYLEKIATVSGVAELSGHVPKICHGPTVARAVALRLLGRDAEAAVVEAELKAIEDMPLERRLALARRRKTEA